MKINPFNKKDFCELPLPDDCIVIAGDPIDTRESKALLAITEKYKSIHRLIFDPDELVSFLDGNDSAQNSSEELEKLLRQGEVILDATSLGVPELLECLKVVNGLNLSRVYIAYAQPKSYFANNNNSILDFREFNLTEQVRNFMALPQATIMASGNRRIRALMFVGFEGERCFRAIEENALSDISVVFGVPAYTPGWEINSYDSILPYLKDINVKISFAGALNPLAAYDSISEVYRGRDEENDEQLLIVPLGTTPHTIGALLFAASHRSVGVMYDYPVCVSKRTDGIECWHLYEILELNE